MKNKPFPYQVTVTWSDIDECYVARVPAFKGCLACGDTQREALAELRTVSDLWMKVTRENGFALPSPDTALERLKALAPVVKMASVAKLAGISVQTLASKMQRGTALSADEERRLGSVLAAHGVAS
jgi:predicted RNase H-like HicB family nuclease